MKKKLLGCLLLLSLISCNSNSDQLQSNHQSDDALESISDSSIDYNNLNKITYAMTLNYGNYIVDGATLLFGDSFKFFNEHDYGIEKLYAGDVVTVYYTGEILIQETYPSNVILNGEIKDIKVQPAEKIYFEVSDVPGGGFEILNADGTSTNYIFPDYYVVEGTTNYYSKDALYSGLKFLGTISTNKSFSRLDGLYAINFDSSKFNNTPSKTTEEKFNDYFADLEKINNNSFDNDYYLSLEYTSKDQEVENNYAIEFQRQGNKEFLKYSSNDDSYTYCLEDNNINLYYNNIIYNEELIHYGNLKKNLLNNFKIICDIYSNNKPLILENKYEDYSFDFYQIDPCCNGPAYLLVKNKDFDIQVYLETKSFIFFSKDQFIENINSYVPFDKYISDLKSTSSLIKLDGEYSFLQEISPSKIDENKYQYNPGFGIFDFYLKDNANVIYTSYSFPDCYFSYNSCITKIEIIDKNFHFNNLTLNDSSSIISNEFLKLGFESFSQSTSSDNYKTLSFEKNGLIISLITNNDENISITFSTKSTNIYKIVY